MKHKAKGRKFSRSGKQRRALIKTLLGSLMLKEKIQTTEAKAKEIKPLMDRLINKAKAVKSDEKKKAAIARYLNQVLPRKAAEKLAGDFINKFENRTSGYTRIVKSGRRKSDGAKMAVIEFV